MRFARLLQVVVTGWTLLTVALLAVSCADQNSGSNASVKGLTQDDADRLNASNQKFASMDKDPPLTAPTHFAAGQLAESQGAYEQAIQQYREALRIDPKNEPSLYRLGVVQTQLRQYPQAIETWKHYVALTKGSAIGYSNLAFCYELSGDNADAEKTYQQAISRDPKCVPARNNYGLMLARTGHVDQALEQLQAVFKPAEAQYNVASVLEQMGKKAEAREHYNKALQLDPNFVEAKKRLAEIN